MPTVDSDKKGKRELPLFVNPGAGNEARTRDLNLGKVALYQLSYSRRSLHFDSASSAFASEVFVVLLKLAVYAAFVCLGKFD